MSAPSNSARVPAGVPTGGQFSVHPRGEAAVDLNTVDQTYEALESWPLLDDANPVEEWEADLAQCGLHFGEWAEHGPFRVRVLARDVETPASKPERFTSGEPADGGPTPLEPSEDLDLEVQVRDTHPEADEPDPDSPGWAKPRTAPAAGQRVPNRYANTSQGRGRLTGFMLRQLNNSIGDLEAAWKDLGRLIEDSTPQVR